MRHPKRAVLGLFKLASVAEVLSTHLKGGRRWISNVLTVGLEQEGNRLKINLGIDGEHLQVGVEVPCLEDGMCESEANILAAAMGLLAGQVVLEPNIGMLFPLNSVTIGHLREIAKILYGAHAFTQNRGRPRINLSAASTAEVPLRQQDFNPKRAVLLWSGGKDALAALEVLRAHRYEVIGLHANANFACETEERIAAIRLANIHDVPLRHLTLDWEPIRHLGQKHSNAFDRYPVHNAIPHGRDLVLLIAAAVVARNAGAGYVCAGYEYDLWDKTVPWHGEAVARHDIQSRPAGLHLNGLLTSTLGLRFFSPIAPFREYRIMKHLARRDGVWDTIQSCFWGEWCGLCSKCLRYALILRHFENSAIPFQVDPLSPTSKALENLAASITNRTIPYWEQQAYVIFQLQRRGVFETYPEVERILVPLSSWYARDEVGLLAQLQQVVPDPISPLKSNLVL
jgi:hypothetical protein